MKAILFSGGWSGHSPHSFAAWARELLEQEGFTVEIAGSLEPLAEPDRMRQFDLIIPIWSSQGSSHSAEHGNLSLEQEAGLLAAVESGVGIGGWHGHMADAFRDRPNYHFLVGGQFVAHPPGWPDNPDPESDFIEYEINIRAREDPIVAGIPDFRLRSEQYYMHVDPSNQVLATTTFSGEYLSWIEGCVMPVVWKRRWGAGRVFYCSIGHRVRELNIPEVREIMRRGLLWSARRQGGTPASP